MSIHRPQYLTCQACSIMVSAVTIHNGKCHRCRQDSAMARVDFIALIIICAGFAVLLWVLIGNDRPRASSLAWQRCYDRGDWRETDYCTAAAQDMEEV